MQYSSAFLRTFFLLSVLTSKSMLLGSIQNPDSTSQTAPFIQEQSLEALPQEIVNTNLPSAENVSDHFVDALNGNFDPNAFAPFIEAILRQQHEGEIKRAAEERRANLEALTPELRALVESTSKSYASLLTMMRVEKIFSGICSELIEALSTTKDTVERGSIVLTNLHCVHRALESGIFAEIAIPQQLSFDSSNPEALVAAAMKMVSRMTRQLTPEDMDFSVKNIIDLRVELEKMDKGRVPAQLHDKVEILIEGLLAAEKRDSRAIVAACIRFIKPSVEEISKTLQRTVSSLVTAQLECSTDANATYVKALESWVNHFKTYQHTLRSFLSLVDQADINIYPFLTMFSTIYDLASPHFDAHWDMLRVRIAGVSLLDTMSRIDGALRAAFAAFVFFQQRNDGAQKKLEDAILGEGSLNDFVNPHKSWEYTIPVAIGMIPLLLNPRVMAVRMHPMKTAMLRILGSYFWYIVFEQDIVNHPLANDRGMRTTFHFTIRLAHQYLDAQLRSLATAHVDPITLENIEDRTLGLLKPELIGLSLEILVPLMFLHRQSPLSNIIHFQKYEFLLRDFWYSEFLRSRLQPQNGGRLNLDDYNNLNLYIEYKIMHYVCQNVGGFLGGRIAGCFKDQVHNFILNVIQGAAIVSHDILDFMNLENHMPDFFVNDYFMLKESIFQVSNGALSSSDKLTEVKRIIREILEENGLWRGPAIAYLQNFGILKHGMQDAQQVNFTLVSMVLHYLAAARLIRHSKSAELMHEYVAKYQYNVKPFIDIIFEQIKEGATVATGSFLGNKLGWIAADKLLNRLRPAA